MSRTKIDADRKRGKGHLIKSQFQDVPLISPTPEKEYSNSRRCTLYSSVYDQEPSRPDSPLPPLNIEKEPNRHDEPEEFYLKLEKKVLRIYHKLFMENESNISSNYSASDMEYIETDHTAQVSTNFKRQNSFHANSNDNLEEMTSNSRSNRKRPFTAG